MCVSIYTHRSISLMLHFSILQYSIYRHDSSWNKKLISFCKQCSIMDIKAVDDILLVKIK